MPVLHQMEYPVLYTQENQPHSHKIGLQSYVRTIRHYIIRQPKRIDGIVRRML